MCNDAATRQEQDPSISLYRIQYNNCNPYRCTLEIIDYIRHAGGLSESFPFPRRNSSPRTSSNRLEPTAPMSRSFTGCKRCKARRQKGDELRPNCGRCQTAGEQCQYAMQLQWGGRAFSRSRFGACVGTGGMQRLGMSFIPEAPCT